MLFIILKSSACLAIFMLFYKLCLEKTSAHTFKRLYLISAILFSIGIPFITFTEYVHVEPINYSNALSFINSSKPELLEITQPKDYLSIILWNMYAMGVIIFTFRFFKNLYQLFQKVTANPLFRFHKYIYVLVSDLVHPHTFLNYIFLNKDKFEQNLIPKEVIIHEQTHAKQKHALDILFIEILQIVFWFNPLLYLIKKDVKLNHEFLADQAVINKGFSTKKYQELLLAFSSNAAENPLANAINYSLIKKRFTVMKTQTSKKALWLRSAIILPLLAILIYGFSNKTIIEKEISSLNKKEILQEFLIEGKNNFIKNDSINTVEEKVNSLKIIQPNNQEIDSIIIDIIVLINSKNEILLNNELVQLDNLLNAINKLNPNLTDDQKRKFQYAKIKYQTNTPEELVKSIQNILRKANIWSYSTENIEINTNKDFKNDIPDLPLMPFGELSQQDKIIYNYKLYRYKEWLSKNKPNRKLEETKFGYVIKNEHDKVIFSTDANVESEPLELKKDSPWKIETGVDITVEFEDSAKGSKVTSKFNNNSLSDIFSIETSSLVIDADTLDELKNFDWNSLKKIFAKNNSNTLITLEFNYNNQVFLGDSKVDKFHFEIEDKTSELDEMIKKAKKIISSLKPI